MTWLRNCSRCGLPKNALNHRYACDYASRQREIVASIFFLALVAVVLALAAIVGSMVAR